MDVIAALLVGVLLGMAGMVSAMRRAAKHPDGSTARAIAMLTGP